MAVSRRRPFEVLARTWTTSARCRRRPPPRRCRGRGRPLPPRRRIHRKHRLAVVDLPGRRRTPLRSPSPYQGDKRTVQSTVSASPPCQGRSRPLPPPRQVHRRHRLAVVDLPRATPDASSKSRRVPGRQAHGAADGLRPLFSLIQQAAKNGLTL